MHKIHKGDYYRISQTGKSCSLISAALFITSLALCYFLKGYDISTILNILTFMFLVAFVIFFTMYIMYKSLIKNVGKFEEIHVKDTEILYVSEKNGNKKFKPGNIEAIKMKKPPKSNVINITIFTDNPKEAFHVPLTISNYGSLEDELKEFMMQNKVSS